MREGHGTQMIEVIIPERAKTFTSRTSLILSADPDTTNFESCLGSRYAK